MITSYVIFALLTAVIEGCREAIKRNYMTYQTISFLILYSIFWPLYWGIQLGFVCIDKK